DGATGSGYIMYSPQSVHERFSGIPAAVSDHFIVVIHQQGVWKYDNNGQIREFTPLAGDTLVASIDFDASQVTALAGVRGLVHGMPSGYLDGDLVFYADQYAGVPNDGEFQVGGTYLTTNVASARYQIGALGQGIAANDLATGGAYLLYSAESLFDRFSNAPIPALNSEHLIVAFYVDSQWHFDANGATRTFTPRETDVILADINYTNDTIISLQGMLSDRHGIQAGFVDGDLVFHANRWNGADNAGEFQVDGSWFSTLSLAVTTVQSDFAGQVHTHDTSGAGHLMFSREPLSERFTFDRVPYGANEHLVAVRYADGQWQYDDGEAWIAFVPLASDMIVADLDFAAGEVELLERVFGRVHGVDTGYLAGDLTVTPNAEGFLVAGAVVRRRALEANTSFSVGLLAGGIAARDEATDRGFLMFTQQEIADRFGNVPSGVSAQLILVVYQNGRWHYDNNGSLFPFTPRGSDVLLAEVDYLNDTITSLEGRTGSHHGIQLGYLNGNLQFFANQFGGVANYGEFQVTGSYFSTAMELDRFQLGPIGAGIAANDNATGPAHILYSVENLFDRFSNQPPISQNSAHMIVVFHNNDQWYYDANGVVRPFTPRATDTILADVDYDTGGVTSLEGQVVERHGISAGFSKGDLTFLGNYWGGSANDGEFKVTGTYFDVVARDKHEQSVGSLNDGVAARVNATGEGYLMYSGQAVSTRFAVAAPPAGASDHVVIVVYENGQWLYDNGTTLTPFTPDNNDVLLAEIDFDANTVTPLRDEFGEYQGIRFGYSGGDLRYVAEQYAGAAAAGQFQVTGQLFLVHSDPVVSPLGTLRGGIAARDNAQESGYLMYSAQALGQRFGDMPGNTSDHLAPVVFQNGAWHYDNGSQLVQFTPAAGDVLLAEVDFASDTLVSLAGRLGSHEGIASGFLDGDLAFFVNQFGGVPNAGEFQITGTYFTR
ncbi:MAG: hypothetical protein KDE20_13670, partial [Caldilineaceae bacterium]|nr:hypothetical protein [Caldilineaceae bacterium]